MKIKINIVLISFVILLSSCDKIDGPYREVNNSGNALDENSIIINGDTITFTQDVNNPQRKVLIEDYTGHLCGTCPSAGITLNDTLRPLFGDKLVVLGIHTGHFADVCPTALDCPGSAPSGAFTMDYRTPVGNDWTDFFGISAFPLGMINRRNYPSAHKSVYRDWQSGIADELTHAPTAALQVKTKYDPSTRELKAAIRSTLLHDFSTNLKLQVLIAEDSIADWQQWYAHSPQLVPDYLHRDILRTTMNGNYGSEISSSGQVTGKKFISGFYSTLDAGWNADHCNVVAFIYDPDTYYIYQVEQVHIGL